MAASIKAYTASMRGGAHLCALQSLGGRPASPESDSESDDERPASNKQLNFSESKKQHKKRYLNTGGGGRKPASKQMNFDEFEKQQKQRHFNTGSGGRKGVEAPVKLPAAYRLEVSGKENSMVSHQKKRGLENPDAVDGGERSQPNNKARKKTVLGDSKQKPAGPVGTATVDPFEAQHRKRIQKHASPFRLEKKLLAKGAAAMAGVSRAQSIIVVKEGLNLVLGDPKQRKSVGAGEFNVGKYLGGGTYGSVFSLRPANAAAGEDVALKVETGVRHLPWEFHVLRKLQKRVLGGPDATGLSPKGLARRSAELNNLVMAPRALVMYRDVSCLLLPRASGTLFRVVQAAIEDSGGLSEVSAAYYVSRMLRVVELTFSADLLHGDIKLDNFVVSPNPVGESSWPLRLTLIDWGRSIDRRDYGSGTAFLFNRSTLEVYGTDAKELVCGAQWHSEGGRGGDGPGWAHELDLHALAVCVLRLVLPASSGDAILERHKRDCSAGGRMGKLPLPRGAPPGLKLARGWNDLWGNLVGDLLNPHLGTNGSSRTSSFIRLLRTHRQSLEDFFELHETKLTSELQRHLRRL